MTKKELIDIINEEISDLKRENLTRNSMSLIKI